MEIIQYPEVDSIDKCKGCGAITVHYVNNENVTMPLIEFENTYGKVSVNKNKHGKKVYSWRGKSANCAPMCCNRCVNGWSTDYCECGSKKPYQKCCNSPSQQIPNIKDLQLCIL